MSKTSNHIVRCEERGLKPFDDIASYEKKVEHNLFNPDGSLKCEVEIPTENIGLNIFKAVVGPEVAKFF
ncbi:MAG: hypothetical protein HY959_03845 [Ignavibacteriae bacterium]|nr:hypothetical protein [Ignavibacteriota bacterium]